uniref:Transposase n=1 Tax=Steinernema glaseri TaxID=37863 RepID=A0A1I7YA68_9BILA
MYVVDVPVTRGALLAQEVGASSSDLLERIRRVEERWKLRDTVDLRHVLINSRVSLHALFPSLVLHFYTEQAAYILGITSSCIYEHQMSHGYGLLIGHFKRFLTAAGPRGHICDHVHKTGVLYKCYFFLARLPPLGKVGKYEAL